ncbi:MAG: DEAD/DEAH box helicase [Marinifilaceae bacterium]
MNSFENLGLSQPVVEAIGKLGFENPTPIQEQAIPFLLEGNQDFVGLAQTGTGKTAAYGLPLLDLISPDERATKALILSPTRELGLQIADDLKKFSGNIRNLNVVAVYGGASIEEQIRKIKKGAQVIVATPGRLLDLIRRRAIDLRELEYLVLDEADEMLNMGFKEDIDAILSETNEDKRTWLFSATMPREVRNISKNYMDNPHEITVGTANTTNQNIEHHYYLMNNRDRYDALKRIVDFYPEIYGIIFCRTRRETQEVAEYLMRDGYNADALHGELTQQQRDRVMRKFKNRSLQLLVATDVAARGIDVDNLTHVLHYNLPDELEFYTHRSGRTARAGRTGISLALITPKEERKIGFLRKKLNANFTKQNIPVGNEVCEKQALHFVQRLKETEIKEEEMSSFMPSVFDELQDLDRDELIKRLAALEFSRFADYYRDAKDLNIKAGSSRRSNDRDRDYGVNESEKRLFINIGKKDGMDVPRLLNQLHRVCGVRGKNIGRIDLKGVYTFFNVESKYVDDVFKGFSDVVIAGRKVRVEEAGDEQAPSRGKRYGKPRKEFSRDNRGGRKPHRGQSRFNRESKRY